jgi:hypothetical protein
MQFNFERLVQVMYISRETAAYAQRLTRRDATVSPVVAILSLPQGNQSRHPQAFQGAHIVPLHSTATR